MTPSTEVPPNEYPPVFIGMPVYNEASYIHDALGSLLAQDYPNLTVYVSDNASTDDTQAIVTRLAAEDSRVTYERLTTNIGAAANFRYVERQCDGEFFMWAAGHDLWSPTLLSEAVSLLVEHQDAVLAVVPCRWVDESGDLLEKESGHTDTRGMGPIERFNTVYWGNMHPILGLIRRSHMNQVQPLKDCVGTDLIYLTELALRGDFLMASGATWSRRANRAEESNAQRMQRYTSSDYALTKSLLDRHLPLLRLPLELLKVVARSRLAMLEKAALMVSLCASLPVRYLSGRQ
jgi:glycosyltransferase involved in cell wall biosynthesis